MPAGKRDAPEESLSPALQDRIARSLFQEHPLAAQQQDPTAVMPPPASIEATMPVHAAPLLATPAPAIEAAQVQVNLDSFAATMTSQLTALAIAVQSLTDRLPAAPQPQSELHELTARLSQLEASLAANDLAANAHPGGPSPAALQPPPAERPPQPSSHQPAQPKEQGNHPGDGASQQGNLCSLAELDSSAANLIASVQYAQHDPGLFCDHGRRTSQGHAARTAQKRSGWLLSCQAQPASRGSPVEKHHPQDGSPVPWAGRADGWMAEAAAQRAEAAVQRAMVLQDEHWQQDHWLRATPQAERDGR